MSMAEIEQVLDGKPCALGIVSTDRTDRGSTQRTAGGNHRDLLGDCRQVRQWHTTTCNDDAIYAG